MARIRSIKADLSEDLRFETISEAAMLLFLLLKPHADDTGVICIDKMQVLRAKAYTVREDITIQMVRERMAELETHDFLRTFEFKGSKYAALDFSDERIEKARPGILKDGPNFHTLAPKKDASGTSPDDSGKSLDTSEQMPDASGTFRNVPPKGEDLSGTTPDDSRKLPEHSGTFRNVPPKVEEVSGTPLERSGKLPDDSGTFRDDSGTFQTSAGMFPPGKERSRKGEGEEGESSSSSSAGAHTGMYTHTRVGEAESPAAVVPQGLSGAHSEAPQAPIEKPANGLGSVDRENPKPPPPTESLPVEAIPLPEALAIYLSSTRLKKNREELMMATGLAEPQYLELWGKAFNSHLLTEGREDTKVLMDYCSHFSRWLKKQSTHTHPNPATLKTATEDAKASKLPNATERPKGRGSDAIGSGNEHHAANLAERVAAFARKHGNAAG